LHKITPDRAAGTPIRCTLCWAAPLTIDQTHDSMFLQVSVTSSQSAGVKLFSSRDRNS
jgi:hypothetical protein